MIVNTLLCLVPMVLCFCHANLALVDASLNKLGCFLTFWLVKGVGAIFWVLDFLGSGFFGFWVLGIILNFPEPPFLAREFPRTLANFTEPK
jgi:hypothetical protein